MIRYIWGILIVGLTFYIALIYGSIAIALLGFAEVSFVVLSILFLIYMAYHIQFDLEIPIIIAEQGQKVLVCIKGKNTSLFSCPKVRCKVQLNHNYGKPKQRGWIWAWFGAARDLRCEYHVMMKQAGGYELTLEKIRVYDMSGIFYITKKIERSETIEVIPEFMQVQVKLTEGVLHFIGDCDVYDDLHAGNDPSESFQIREFQKGDKIQSIHWKLSARAQKLMVRENSQPKACPVVLILEAGNGWSGDLVLKISASLSFSMMDAGCIHSIAWYSSQSNDVVRIRVDDEEGFYQFLAYFMKEGNVTQNQSTLELYEQKYRSEIVLHKLVVNSELEIYQDQKLLIRLKEQQVEEALKKIELIL